MIARRQQCPFLHVVEQRPAFRGCVGSASNSSQRSTSQLNSSSASVIRRGAERLGDYIVRGVASCFVFIRVAFEERDAKFCRIDFDQSDSAMRRGEMGSVLAGAVDLSAVEMRRNHCRDLWSRIGPRRLLSPCHTPQRTLPV